MAATDSSPHAPSAHVLPAHVAETDGVEATSGAAPQGDSPHAPAAHVITGSESAPESSLPHQPPPSSPRQASSLGAWSQCPSAEDWPASPEPQQQTCVELRRQSFGGLLHFAVQRRANGWACQITGQLGCTASASATVVATSTRSEASLLASIIAAIPGASASRSASP